MRKIVLSVLMLLGIATLAVSLVACGGGGADGPVLVPTPAPVASFAGVYSGTYTGTDSGTVTVTIAPDGSITGSGSSNSDPGNQFPYSGQIVAGGKFSISSGTSTLTGTVTSQGVLAGTWSDGATGSGNFTTHK